MRILTLLLAAAVLQGAVKDSASRLVEITAKAPATVRLEYRLMAAEALQQRYPELARKFLDAALEELRTAEHPQPSQQVLRMLAATAPAETVALVPRLPGNFAPQVAAYLAQAHHPAEAAKVFQGWMATVGFEPLEPADAWRVINAAGALGSAAPAPAIAALERVLQAATAADWGKSSQTVVKATFLMGGKTVETANSRDSVLIAAGSRLRGLAPDRFEKMQGLFAAWDLTGPVMTRSVNQRGGTPSQPVVLPPAPAMVSIRQRMGQIRGLPSDKARAESVVGIVADIKTLPDANDRLTLARGLSNLSTEGDLGKEALGAVAGALAAALKDTQGSSGDYMELASLVRYERLTVPADPALDAAGAILELRESLHQEAGFTLTGLDGKTYTLAGLRGKIVLLNFWATWCPPCRKEMPDMEKLYQTFQKQGLVVLAVSDEPRETVAPFIEKQKYSFPVLLDTDRKVHTAFDVDGIPKSFIFDREGRLAAQAIDMRTERQFLELLKQSGLD